MKLDEALNLSVDVLKEGGVDNFIFFACNSETREVAAEADGKTDIVATAVCSVMERHKEAKDIILKACAMYAKRQGNILELHAPQTPNLN